MQGTVLVLSIIMIAILTVISISMVGSSILKEKMAYNAFNRDTAFQSSETALKAAETWVLNLSARPQTNSSCSSDCDIVWAKDALKSAVGAGYGARWWAIANSNTNESWWANQGRLVPSEIVDGDGNSVNETLSYVHSQPRFIIEEAGFIPDDLNPTTRANGIGTYFYRITARGTGMEVGASGESTSQVLLQSIVAKRFN